MISGKVALGGLTLEFGNQQKRFDRLSREVEALTKAQSKLIEREKKIIEDLARTYLPELTPEAVSAGLTELRTKMDSALGEQEAHRRVLVERLGDLPEDIARRELLLAEAEGAEERAARGLDEVRALVEAELGADAEHKRNVTEHRALMERRSLLKARRIRLNTAASVDRRKYEENKAVAYLLRRQYSEPGYRGRFVARWLDGWLARRIDYPTLLRNYRILRTGPAAIQAEIRQLSERARDLELAIDEQEERVSGSLGLAAALEAVASAQRGLLDARRALTEVRSGYDRLTAEIRAVDASRGRPYENAIALHREFLEERTITELLDIARGTADPRDDELVSRLDDLRSRLEDIGGKLVPLRERLDRTAASTTSLADIARQAMTEFTSRRSRFPEEFNLAKLVSSIVDGESDTEDALGRIAASHVKQPILIPSMTGDFDGWFAELSSRFDPELGAVSVRVEEGPGTDAEVVVYDGNGRVLHRRVTKRRG